MYIMKGVIVADIISSTSLSLGQLSSLREELQNFIDEYVGWFNEYGCVLGTRCAWRYIRIKIWRMERQFI